MRYICVKQDIRISMFPWAGQTAGPNGLKFFERTHGYPGGVTKAKKNKKC